MPVGEGLYAHIEIEFVRGAKFLGLPVGARMLYLAIWCYALGQKREIIERPPDDYLTSIAGLRHHPITSYLRLLHVHQLLSFDDRHIHVLGLRKKHSKIKFKEEFEIFQDHLKNSPETLFPFLSFPFLSDPPKPPKGGKSADADVVVSRPEKTDGNNGSEKAPRIPFAEFFALYGEFSPPLKKLPTTAHDDDVLRTSIRRAWKNHPDFDWWRAYFSDSSKSDFLAGKSTDFVASLPWLIGPKNMAKVLGGAYVNSGRSQTRIQLDDGETWGGANG